MSKAFTREDDADQQSDLPERAIPPYPNLVTAEGLAQIEDALTRFTEQHDDARAAGDTVATASTARDMRYKEIGDAVAVGPSEGEIVGIR